MSMAAADTLRMHSQDVNAFAQAVVQIVEVASQISYICDGLVVRPGEKIPVRAGAFWLSSVDESMITVRAFLLKRP